MITSLITYFKEKKDKNIIANLAFLFLSGLYKRLYRIIPPAIIVKQQYKQYFGKDLDLGNPQTFNEKLQWKKIYDHNPIYTVCADKYRVRDLVKEKIGEKYLIPLYLATNKPGDIDFDKITTPFIVKPNHMSAKYMLVKTKSDLNPEEIRKNCVEWLNNNFYYDGLEWHYKNIEPMIVVEKLLLTDEGKVPEDYKFFCFDGKVKIIQVSTDRFGDRKLTYLDTEWNILPFRSQECEIKMDVKKPQNLVELISTAERLSKDFDFVRVDLYSLNNEVYFGELTFTPYAGFNKYYPEEFDEILGRFFKLKKLNQ